METYSVKVIQHKWSSDNFYRECSRCEREEARDSYIDPWGATYFEGYPEKCEVEVERCICFKSHFANSHEVKCLKAGECICSPCECDCHYE
jgi:hypothetical protein